MVKRSLSCVIVAGLVVAVSGCAIGASAPTEQQGIAIGACNPLPCARLNVSDVPALLDSLGSVAKERVVTQVSEVLYAPLDDEASELSLSSLQSQIKTRQDEMVGLSTAPIDWILERKASVLFANSEVVTIAITSLGYLGGAHGFNELTLLCFGAQDGRRLTLAELVRDESTPTLRQVAEAEFRRVRGIAPDRSLADEGFFLNTGEPFSITENFGVVEQGILLHYNPYEIGPYVMGETDVVLPRDTVLPLLKSDKVAHIFDAPTTTG